ncbi:uncharacterized protein LOC143250258 [Tachypleus tridentatus]|uniref:uncharacterized protein LOC143250258 n=1 Tax=Tachypleus tridentatus TaxID=6853 RepID=UPI003FD4896D
MSVQQKTTVCRKQNVVFLCAKIVMDTDFRLIQVRKERVFENAGFWPSERADSKAKFRVWEPGPSCVVCHDHFVPTHYYSETSFGYEPQAKRLRPNAVPSVLLWTTSQTSEAKVRAARQTDITLTLTSVVVVLYCVTCVVCILHLTLPFVVVVLSNFRCVQCVLYTHTH